MHKFEIGEIVYVPVKITEISIKPESVTYKAKIKTSSGTCSDWFKEEDVAGDLVLGTISDGKVFNPIERWNPALINKSKEETNAKT